MKYEEYDLKDIIVTVGGVEIEGILESSVLYTDIFGKQDSRPARQGWATGNYTKTCTRCKERFTGDKRSVHCADCAYSIKPSDEQLNLLGEDSE